MSLSFRSLPLPTTQHFLRYIMRLIRISLCTNYRPVPIPCVLLYSIGSKITLERIQIELPQKKYMYFSIHNSLSECWVKEHSQSWTRIVWISKNNHKCFSIKINGESKNGTHFRKVYIHKYIFACNNAWEMKIRLNKTSGGSFSMRPHLINHMHFSILANTKEDNENKNK